MAATPYEAPAAADIAPPSNSPHQDYAGVFADVNMGTQGVGINLGYEIDRYVKLRLRASWLGYQRSDTWDSMNVVSKLNGSSVGFLVDYHPYATSFRITAGFNYSPLSVEANGVMSTNGIETGKIYTLGDHDYRVSEGQQGRVKGRYKWHSLQPYIGLGWASDLNDEGSLYFNCDLGINIMGKGNLSVNAGSNIEQSPHGQGKWSPVSTSILKDSMLEEGKDFFKIADKLYVYPVLQFGIGYHF